MKALSRTGISIESELLDQFDRLIADRGYENRSEALRDLIRESLVSKAADNNEVVVGTLTMVYDHHRPNLTQKLTEAQHQSHGKVLAATHVHLDDDYCLEVIIMKGRNKEIKNLADRMLSLRGVKNGKLVLTTTGQK
ncbi:MAG TPA: nickel-responsive transcriptional regulator NikR [Acidobacteriaceae bacterium]|jgi:CopG family nickel-responsive transcriptional regulator